MWRIGLTLAVICLLQLDLQAQVFRPRNQSNYSGETPRAQGNSIANSQEQPSKTSSVSADLLQVYSQTSTAKSESDLTAIARATAKVLGESKRSKADRDYASNLLAWSLNRRGELRSEQAAELLNDGKAEQAAKLDSQAADDFATAVEYSPSNWRHHHNYAIALALQNNYSKAIEHLDKTIQLNPQYANARFNRGELFFESGNYKAAEKDYTSAIEMTADSQYFNSRAHCRFMLEDYDSALNDYQQAVKLSADNAVYQTDLGDACQFLGKWEEAGKAYRAAVAADNTYPRAYQNAAWLMATCPKDSLRNTDLAMSAAKKAVELTGSRTAETVETLAAATAAMGKHAEAAKLQEEALKIAVKNKTNEKDLTEFKQRLDLYKAGEAYVQPQPTETASSPTRTASR
jgi:tetratricopeptide (TPR) repeat protein